MKCLKRAKLSGPLTANIFLIQNGGEEITFCVICMKPIEIVSTAEMLIGQFYLKWKALINSE